MQKLLGLFLLLLSASVPFAQPRDTIIVQSSNVIAVTVSAPGELDALARRAFNAHGAFTVAPRGGRYDIKFTSVGNGQIRVDVTEGTKSVLSQAVGGTTLRNALFRAADAAVKAITGQPGFFSTKLAFISDKTGRKEIYVSDLFLGEAKQITRDNAAAFTPRWSPDGSKLVYTSFFRKAPDIYSIDLTTYQRTVIADYRGSNSGARYSPDGSQIAMVLSAEGNPEVYVGSPAGKGRVKRLTNTTEYVESSPCFSPDGRSIVFVSDRAGKPQLYVMPAGGGQPQRVTTGYAYSAEPDWNRVNRNLIAFTAAIGRGYQVGVADITGKVRPRIVSDDAADAVEPSWLADGRHIIYTAKSAGRRNLVILDTGATGSDKPKRTVISTDSAEKPSPWWP